jgi:uncharacterized protein
MNHQKQQRQQILFAHSAGTQEGPGEGSFDFVSQLKSALAKDYEIHYPIIDDPEAPTYEMWRTMFDDALRKISKPLILIGHSLGGSMLLKYLSKEQPDTDITALFLVATPAWGKRDWKVAEFMLRKDFQKSLGNIPRIYLYHCINDEIVPFDHLNFYTKAFPMATVRALDGNDHAFANGLPELVADIRLPDVR